VGPKAGLSELKRVEACWKVADPSGAGSEPAGRGAASFYGLGLV
jgi:hypothetical protein